VELPPKQERSHFLGHSPVSLMREVLVYLEASIPASGGATRNRPPKGRMSSNPLNAYACIVRPSLPHHPTVEIMRIQSDICPQTRVITV
jgi:hypothetical protein